MSDPARVVWDSCVLIDAIDKTPGRYEQIEPYEQDAREGNLLIIISEVTVAETRTLKSSGKSGLSPEGQAQLIRDWLENPFIVRRSVHPGISELAAELGRQYRIKRATDTIVLATALRDDIREVHTFDGEGSKRGLIDLDGLIGEPPLRIMVPNHAQGTLWKQDNNE